MLSFIFPVLKEKCILIPSYNGYKKKKKNHKIKYCKLSLT